MPEKPERLDVNIIEFLLDLQYKKVIYLSNNDEALFYGKQIFDILKEKIPDEEKDYHKDSICQILEDNEICPKKDQVKCPDTTACNKGF
ncbi:hypothetical protein KAR91_84435 [Candidatus Pacearchaeota archaeon]|nr:hypothetical protein [Candidatus Pacearchaeota archaeon]